ncbi:MAG: tRNA (adenosine(37)-N6)-threonylcarbamoyltransferase complex ATPase subunit type 1 TsaE [Limnochordia bacterium]|jgi:tRNA threonylcarbamoyladenosine biosynthesis protein TsaE
MVIKVDSPEAMEALGEKLAQNLKPGTVISLNGQLGAGKTVFSRGLGRGLGVEGIINSPSFTLINEYEGRVPFYHMDVYRLDDPGELEDLGFEEYFYGSGVTVVEWGKKVKELMPPDHLEIEIRITGEHSREVEFTVHGQMELGGFVDEDPGP